MRRTTLLQRVPSPCCRNHSPFNSTHSNKNTECFHRSFFSTYVPYSTTSVSHQSAAVLASTYDDADDKNRNDTTYDHAVDDEGQEVERFLRDSAHHFLPNAAPYASRLELELGELREHNSMSIWKDSHFDDYYENDDEENGADELEIVEQDAAGNIAQNILPPPLPTQHSPESSKSEPDRPKSVRELLAKFDPDNEPAIFSDGNRDKQLEELQLWLECSAQVEALAKYQKVIDSARKRKDFTSLSPVQRNMMKWFDGLQRAIEALQHRFLFSDLGENGFSGGKRFGPYLCTLPAAKLALLTCNVTILQTILTPGRTENSAYGCPISKLAEQIGKAVEEEVVIHRMLHKRFEESSKERYRAGKSIGEGQEGEDNQTATNAVIASKASEKGVVTITHRWSYAASHLNRYLDELSMSLKPTRRNRTDYAVRKARKALESEDEWDKGKRIQLGAALFKCLLDTATVTSESGKEEPAFVSEKKWLGKAKKMGFAKMNERLYQLITKDRIESFAATSTRHKPMVVPPKPWTKGREGGYHMLKVDIMRHHGCETQREALVNADCSTAFEGLNSLGRVPWKINQPILDVAWKCWKDNVPLGDIPSQTDLTVSDEPISPEWPEGLEKGTADYEAHVKNFKKYVEQRQKYMRVLQKNMVCVTNARQLAD